MKYHKLIANRLKISKSLKSLFVKCCTIYWGIVNQWDDKYQAIKLRNLIPSITASWKLGQSSVCGFIRLVYLFFNLGTFQSLGVGDVFGQKA